ncbi:MAG: tetratricopeptide repeat protein [Vicinamibacterales bacterium]|nr:tetratricopeptide repeat protein [Vicinamibacterales bacterium]
MQRRFRRGATLALLMGFALSLVACGQVGKLQGKKAFKEANTFYQKQDYAKAAERYEQAIVADPELSVAYFYLGNSYDNLYKPSRKGEAENDEYLNRAIDAYKKAADKETDPKMRRLALEFLVAAYGPDKINDPTQAEPIVQKMIELDPQEPSNYFALVRIHEDGGDYEKAETTLMKAKEARPNDPNVFLQMAAYYNRQEEFEKTIEALEERARLEPNNPEAYYTISTYFWDKAYRDFRLKDQEKRDFVIKGVEAVDKALALKSDYMEALTYKNLLLRLQANLEKDPAKQQSLIREADKLRDQAIDLKKKKVAGL